MIGRLFRRSLVKFTQLDCFRIPGVNSFMARKEFVAALLGIELFGIQALVFDIDPGRRLFGSRFIEDTFQRRCFLRSFIRAALMAMRDSHVENRNRR